MDPINILRDAFPDCYICQQEPPSFVKCHTNESDKIIFVCNKANTNPIVTPKKHQKNDQTPVSVFELTGSPLKLDLGYDKLDDSLMLDLSTFWSPEENAYDALTIDEAKNVVNYYNSIISSLDEGDRLPLWVLCDGQDFGKTLLMGALSYKKHFNRGIVNSMGVVDVSKLSIDKMRDMHWNTFGCKADQSLTCLIEAIYRISGRRTKISSKKFSTSVNKLHNGMTQLECEWSKPTLQIPAHETSVKLKQEVFIGHDISECTVLWRSVCAIQGIRNALISLTNIITPSKIDEITIRPFNSLWSQPTRKELITKLQDLLNEVEIYSGLPHGPKGGCICISDDCMSLHQVFKELNKNGSSNDFTYKLWDILKESDTVEDLISLLVSALKDVYKRNLRPYIDPGNTTFLGNLVKKLARGLSQQAIKSLSTLHTNPTRALDIIGQLGIHKTCWEYTNIFSLVDNALGFNDRLRLQNKATEIDEEALNQTILDMTLGSGDVTVNPFDTKFNLMDSTLGNEAEHTFENLGDLSMDNFVSLKKHNIEIKSERRLNEKDQPLISDDNDVEFNSKEWKFKLMRLAQLHVCMEHLYRAQLSLNSDFNTVKPIIAQLLDFYAADKSPIKTVDQLHNEPVQEFSVPIQYKTVKEHLQFKHATMYLISMKSDSYKETSGADVVEPYQTIKTMFVCSQQPLCPPNVISYKDLENLEELYYYCTRYINLSNSL